MSKLPHVVYLVYWDFGHAELVEYPLAAGRIAVAIAGNVLFDIIVVDVGI
jgi:hypothetical protein